MFYEPVIYSEDLREESLQYLEDDIVFKVVVICMATSHILKKRGLCIETTPYNKYHLVNVIDITTFKLHINLSRDSHQYQSLKVLEIRKRDCSVEQKQSCSSAAQLIYMSLFSHL